MTFLKNISHQQNSDKELLTAFKTTGDINLLAALYQRYIDLVFGVCLKYFKEPERAKDAVMDIFTELNSKLRVHEVENFKGWLHVLSRNHCLMQLRRTKNRRTTEFNPDFMQSVQDTHLDGGVLEKEAGLNKLEACLETLAEEQRQSVKLFYLESKCYNEIAEITGYDWNKVRSYIQNGRRNLKICMETD